MPSDVELARVLYPAVVQALARWPTLHAGRLHKGLTLALLAAEMG